MDTTKKNILMCEKALPIQRLWEFKPGDYFTTIKASEIDLKLCLVDEVWLENSQSKAKIKTGNMAPWIWVPRLDQLLYMVVGDHNQVLYKLHRFSVQTNAFSSNDQVALGLVMLKNYGKIWSDDDWIDYS